MSNKRDYRQIIETEKQERTGRLNLGNCGLTDWPEELFELGWLTHLVMDSQFEWAEESLEYIFNGKLPCDFRNSITYISPRFSKLEKLEYLDCGDLGIKEIENFEKLTALSNLYLDNNRISEIKGLETLARLASLYLYKNRISEIKGLETLTVLSNLSLVGNRITEIKGLETLTQLTSLYLYDNQINEIKGLETLTQLTDLDLSENQIKEIKGLETLTELTDLDLSENQIREIKGLETLTQLTDLDLSENQIRESKGLERLTFLSNLNLSSNEIREIKGLENLTVLEVLDLFNNQIKEIKGLGILVALVDLNLSGNVIKEIKGLETLTSLSNLNLAMNEMNEIKGLEKLMTLVGLDLSRNKLSEIKGLEKLAVLTVLDLSSNQIKKIKGLETPTGLTELNLSRNKLNEIKGLETLIGLRNLNMSSNQISELKGLETLTALTDLNLRFNQIREIKGLETLTGLTDLYLSDNQTREIKGLHTLTGITVLDLSSNLIKEIKELETLTALSRLYLSSNQISEIKGLETLTTLTNLSLSFNQISEIKGLELLTVLKDINLSYNQISEIKGLELLTALKDLDLSYNQISEIKGLETLISLKNLFLCGNPTKNFPKALHEKPSSRESCLVDLKTWFEELRKGKSIKNKQVKMLFTGNGNTGKSCLVEALKYGKCIVEKESTHGIQVELWKPDDNKIFQIWDFGGQEIYHGTHQLFMDGDAIHLVVFDPGTEQLPELPDRINENEITRNQPLAYWIENVKQHNHKNPVIVVQNKADVFDEIDRTANNLALDNKYDFVWLSARTGKNIDLLQFYINRLLPLINEYDMEMPASWNAIRDYYLAEQQKVNNSEPVITLSMFRKTVKEYGIAEKVFPTLLKFLHNNGIIYYNEEYLKDHVIIDQRWALDAIYKILDRKSDFYRLQRNSFKGLCQLQDIWNAWGAEKSEESKGLLLQFMRSCAICFPFVDEGYRNDFSLEHKYIFPEFLIPQKPGILKNQEESIKENFIFYRLKQEFLSYRTIQQLIVEYGTKTPFEYIWRNGIMIKTNTGFCCIEADFKNHILAIAIDSRLENTFLPEIVNKIGGYGIGKAARWQKSEDGVNFGDTDISQIKEKQDSQDISRLQDVRQSHVLKIAISYAREEDDKGGAVYGFNPLQELIDNLSVLESENKVRIFYDKDINENDWDRQTRREFANADLIIVLNSLNYNKGSKRYIWEIEKPIIEKKIQEKDLSVIRINVTDCLSRDFVKKINSFKQTEIPRDKYERDKFFKDFITEQIVEKIMKKNAGDYK